MNGHEAHRPLGRVDPRCTVVREGLASGGRRALRQVEVRRHVRACAGCDAFADEVRRQRGLMAVALPVVPTLGLKDAALAAAGVGGGGATGGGLIAALAAKVATTKVAAVAVVAGGAAIGGGVVVDQGSPPPDRPGDRVLGGGKAGGLVPPSEAAPDNEQTRAPADGRNRARRDENRAARRRNERRGRKHEKRPGSGELPPGRGTARGRELAITRGQGNKRGLHKPPPPRAQAKTKRAKPELRPRGLEKKARSIPRPALPEKK